MAGRAFFAWPKAVAASTHRRKAPTGPRSANIRKFESTEGEPEIIAERALEGESREWRQVSHTAAKRAPPVAFFVERCHEERHRIDVASTETRRFTGFQGNELVPPRGVEPPTFALQVRCSTN